VSAPRVRSGNPRSARDEANGEDPVTKRLIADRDPRRGARIVTSSGPLGPQSFNTLVNGVIEI
jgi:hypothetical protein